MTVRVVTWNVWWRFGDHEARAPGLAGELARVAGDVVCLQEVWAEVGDRDPDQPGQVDGPDTPGASQAAMLAPAVGATDWRYAWRRAHEGTAFGNAVLSRHLISRCEVLALPDGDRHPEHRTALLVEVATPEGPLVVATTHLNYQWDDSATRQLQVAAICRWLAEHRLPDAPVVLTGDLNAEPVSDELRMLTGRAAVPVVGLGFHDAWEVAGHGVGDTWTRANTHTPDPPFEHDKRIDHVLCSYPLPDHRGVPVHAERIGTTPDPHAGHPSDHHGVAVDLTVAPR